MRRQRPAHILRQPPRRAAVDELVQVGVVLAAGQRRLLQVGRRVAVRDQLQQSAADRIELHDREYIPLIGKLKAAKILFTRDILSSTVRQIPRSEEQTSELQSLMRISYAVFCLKKKNT